jgi:hypothetical protein
MTAQEKRKTASEKSRRVALIDGDVVVYRAGYASQKNKHSVIDKEGDVLGVFDTKRDANDYCELLAISGIVVPRIETEIFPMGHDEAEMIVDTMISNIISGSESTEYHIFLSGTENFRNGVATIKGYKETRKGNVKPVHYAHIREYIEQEHPTTMSDGAEADDYLAFTQYPQYLKARESKKKVDCESVICTIDKDLRTVPGHHYNIVKQKLDWVSPKDANRFFATQLLTGDNADNIPGISFLSEGKKRIGPKTALKIIEGCNTIPDLDRAVRDTYAEYVAGDWKAALQEIGTLLWMQRKFKQEFNLEIWSSGGYE